VPLLAWIGLAVVIVLPLAVSLAQRPERTPSLAPYAGTLAAVGTLSVVLPQITATSQRLAEVGFAAGSGLRILLWMSALLLAAAAAMVTGLAARAQGERALAALRYVTWGVLVVAALASWAPIRFLANDWKRGDSNIAVAAPGPSTLPSVLLISIDTLRAD